MENLALYVIRNINPFGAADPSDWRGTGRGEKRTIFICKHPSRAQVSINIYADSLRPFFKGELPQVRERARYTAGPRRQRKG